jgi:amino acid transporter
VVVRINTWAYLISAAGVVISTIIMLFVGHKSFVSHVNSFSEPYTHVPDTYNATIAAGAKDGLAYPSGGHGYSTSSTIGAMFPLLGAMLWVWWGVYLSPEMKAGGRRKRQLITILGAGFGQGLLLFFAFLVFLHVAGYDFMAAATGGYYAVPVAPYYDFFASIGLGSPAAGVILSIALIFGFFTAVYINVAMMQRAPFAWAFDGIAPKVFSRVDARTHTPSIAILSALAVEIPVVIWAAYGTSFTTFIGLFTLFGLVTIFISGVSAVLMAKLRPELYRGSPADWRVAGLPVLPIAGVGAMVMAVFAGADAVHFHTQNGISSMALMLVLPFAVVVAACVYYFAAKQFRLRQGTDISLVYKTIPPD